MKRFKPIMLLISILIIILVIPSIEESLKAFTLVKETQFGNGNVEKAYSIDIDIVANEYFIVGETTSFGAGDRDAFVANFNGAPESGTLDYFITFGTANIDIAYDVMIIGTEIFVTGEIRKPNVFHDAFVAKFDFAGNLLKFVRFGDSDGTLTPNIGLALGYDGTNVYVVGIVGNDAFVAQFDTALNLNWYRRFGDATGQTIARNVEVVNGNVIVIGRTNEFGAGGYDTFVASFDTAGNLQWFVTLGTTNNDEGFGIVKIDSNKFAIVGEIAGATYQNSYIIIMSTGGGYITGKEMDFGDDSKARSIDFDSTAKTLYVTGEFNSPSPGNQINIFLVSFDITLDLLDFTEYGTNTIDRAFKVMFAGGSVHIVGYSGNYPQNPAGASVTENNFEVNPPSPTLSTLPDLTTNTIAISSITVDSILDHIVDYTTSIVVANHTASIQFNTVGINEDALYINYT